jgi:hypothetical protein
VCAGTPSNSDGSRACKGTTSPGVPGAPGELVDWSRLANGAADGATGWTDGAGRLLAAGVQDASSNASMNLRTERLTMATTHTSPDTSAHDGS